MVRIFAALTLLCAGLFSSGRSPPTRVRGRRCRWHLGPHPLAGPAPLILTVPAIEHPGRNKFLLRRLVDFCLKVVVDL